MIRILKLEKGLEKRNCMGVNRRMGGRLEMKDSPRSQNVINLQEDLLKKKLGVCLCMYNLPKSMEDLQVVLR